MQLRQLLSNEYLWAALAAWFIAQFLKIVVELVKNKKLDFTRIVGSGGMPSSHSATVTALTTLIGIREGLGSVAFAATLVISIIVMYDAAGVRYAAGEQAKTLNKLVELWNDSNEPSDEDIDATLKELLGHTRPEVFAGAVLGILVAFVCAAI